MPAGAALAPPAPAPDARRQPPHHVHRDRRAPDELPGCPQGRVAEPAEATVDHAEHCRALAEFVVPMACSDLGPEGVHRRGAERRHDVGPAHEGRHVRGAALGQLQGHAARAGNGVATGGGKARVLVPEHHCQHRGRAPAEGVPDDEEARLRAALHRGLQRGVHLLEDPPRGREHPKVAVPEHDPAHASHVVGLHGAREAGEYVLEGVRSAHDEDEGAEPAVMEEGEGRAKHPGACVPLEDVAGPYTKLLPSILLKIMFQALDAA
mmetsp:Transcript_23351/g.55870  ORF Transcript_23351/g.55870 Transcript_23351/m.55870 type:complete len:265 (-) Transcript_23351:370-1164(-)